MQRLATRLARGERLAGVSGHMCGNSQTPQCGLITTMACRLVKLWRALWNRHQLLLKTVC